MKITFKLIPIPALKDNYIWLIYDELTLKAWIVDPGDAAPVLKIIQKFKLDLMGVFITHHHHDHSAGVHDLIKHFQNLKIYGSYKSSLTFLTHRIKENDGIDCLGMEFKVLEIPGHT